MFDVVVFAVFSNLFWVLFDCVLCFLVAFCV